MGSFLEWGAAAFFFLLIGRLLGADAQLLHLLPLFFIANVLGVISMVPGGLGSFDVFMILGLSAVGVNNNVAVVWLLFYRLFYYVIPFAIGALFFAQDLGVRINARLEGLPHQVLQKKLRTWRSSGSCISVRSCYCCVGWYRMSRWPIACINTCTLSPLSS